MIQRSIQTGSHATFEHQDELYSVAFSPDASAFLVGGLLERRFWDGTRIL
jgi:predicted RNA binding protein YcfA (HicA-like mRNA interferase family)